VISTPAEHKQFITAAYKAPICATESIIPYLFNQRNPCSNNDSFSAAFFAIIKIETWVVLIGD
jgi:hypothetical protein